MAQRKSVTPLVGLVMGSESDWDTMKHAAAQLDAFGVAYETRVVSAHRMPDDLYEYAEDALPRGLVAIIAGAGGAAHLPGMLAAKTTVPVLGVPVPSKYLRGEDSLLAIVQMPKGIPVATLRRGRGRREQRRPVRGRHPGRETARAGGQTRDMAEGLGRQADPTC